MSYNFPDSPTLNQVFGNYTWDGQKWTQTSASVYVAKAGDTMTGALMLAADPAAALQAATKQYVDAHPYPILSINGAMAVSQENGTTAVSVAGAQTYIVDQFQAAAAGVPAAQGQQQTNCPISGLPNSLQINITTAQATLAAGDSVSMRLPIEGLRIARLGWGAGGAQPISIGFYVITSITGTITVSVRNGAANRSYLVDVPITAAGVWQWVTVTIPGDTAAGWTTDTSVGMYVGWGFAIGSTFRGTPGAWQAGSFTGSVNTMNLAASTSNYAALTGVIVVPGTVLPAPAMVPFVLPTYDRELAACQRYWNKITANARFSAAAANQISDTSVYYPPMRITPAVALTLGANANLAASYPQLIPNSVGSSGRFEIQSLAAGDCYALNTICVLNARL